VDFFDYDPVTGITEYIAFEDGQVIIKQEQDVTPYLDMAKELANSGACDTPEMKKAEWRMYAMLPPVVVADMFKRGINLMDPTATKRVVKEINQNYPYCKTTSLKHS
jgi:hypothetical protein